MKKITEELEFILEKYKPLFKTISDDQWSIKPLPNKWSKKEELGHLIDSAQSNVRRFIVGQYEELPYIVYAQDKWVAISNYQNYPVADLIDLWYLINKHICIVLKNTSEENAANLVRTQEIHSIEWLAADYNKHLLHHLHHLLDLQPVAYP